MILTLVKGRKHFTPNFGTFRSNLLSFDTFSKFEMTPLQYFKRSPFFKTKILNTIPIKISFINFSKFHAFRFFLSTFSAKSSVSY